MIVWRIEHAQLGRGPYSIYHCTVGRRLCREHNSARWPTLWEENATIRARPDQGRHGFRRLRDLKRWFSQRNRADLIGAGYILALYTVPGPGIAAIGPVSGQVLFDADRATYVERRPIPRA